MYVLQKNLHNRKIIMLHCRVRVQHNECELASEGLAKSLALSEFQILGFCPRRVFVPFSPESTGNGRRLGLGWFKPAQASDVTLCHVSAHCAAPALLLLAHV